MPDEKWFAGSETGMANEAMFDRYESQEAVNKGFVELKQNASKSMLMPDNALEGDARVTAHKEIMHKLGAPRETDGHDMSKLEMIASWGEEGMKVFKQMAVDSGLQPWQAQKIYNVFQQSEKSSVEARTAKLAEMETSLKTDWGVQYEPNVKGCEDLIDKYGKEDNLLEDMKGVDMALKVKLFKMLNRMQGDFIKEGSLPGSSGMKLSGAPPLLNYKTE